MLVMKGLYPLLSVLPFVPSLLLAVPPSVLGTAQRTLCPNDLDRMQSGVQKGVGCPRRERVSQDSKCMLGGMDLGGH